MCTKQGIATRPDRAHVFPVRPLFSKINRFPAAGLSLIWATTLSRNSRRREITQRQMPPVAGLCFRHWRIRDTKLPHPRSVQQKWLSLGWPLSLDIEGREAEFCPCHLSLVRALVLPMHV